MPAFRFLSMLLLTSACGGATAHNTVDTPDSGLPTADAAGPCNALTNAAPVVTLSEIAGEPPRAQGGTIADGSYVMQPAAYYTGQGGASGPGPTTSQVTIEVSGDTVQVVSSSGGTTSHLTVTIGTEGPSLTYADVCPEAATLHGSYTATATTLTVMLPVGSDGGTTTLVEDFVKH